MATTNGAVVPGMEPTHVENGREFHGWRKGLYMYPCDEAEMERMDIYHTLFLTARDQQLHSAPIEESGSTRILDLGTGTGIWAIDMADKYNQSEVIGIDVVNIQPQSIPPNLRFRVPRDYESMWALGEDSFDLIHLRMAYGGVSHWPEMYQKILRHLKPRSGYLEQVEIDLEPRCDDGEVPEIMRNWYAWLHDATTRGSKSIQYIHQTTQLLQAQGFVDIKETVIKLPFNTWAPDRHGKNVGRWYNLGLCEGLEAMSLGPFTRVFQWPAGDVRRLCDEMRHAICNRNFHVYNNLHIITGRRP